VDLYTTIAAAFRLGWRVLDLDVHPIGYENIPDDGPAILASNHVGYLDFCFVALAPPRPRRQVRFMARHDIFEKPVVGWAMRTMGQIPVDVHGDPASSLQIAEQRLRDGEIVGIHPESTISPSFVPRTGRTGAVRLAQRSGAPIVPVAIWGSQRLLTKWRPERFTRHVAVMVRYGEPFTPGSDPVEATRELMERIGELLAKSQAAYPQRPSEEPGADWWVPAHLGGSAPTPEEAEARLARQAEQRRRRAEEEGRRADGAPPAGEPRREEPPPGT
jgi:1-acyl-sn-glycerol-3-phosphate acyltransferase